jgi:hypothetical protein
VCAKRVKGVVCLRVRACVRACVRVCSILFCECARACVRACESVWGMYTHTHTHTHRLLQHSSCMAAGGLGGGGETDSLLEARVASSVWCLCCWAAQLRRVEEGEGVDGGTEKEGVNGGGAGRSGRDVLQNVLEARDSKDVLDWNSITAGLLSQVLVATGQCFVWHALQWSVFCLACATMPCFNITHLYAISGYVPVL